MSWTFRSQCAPAVLALAAWFCLLPVPAMALDAASLAGLAAEEADARAAAVDSVAAAGDARALAVLTALRDGLLHRAADGRLLVVNGGRVDDAATGESVAVDPDTLEKVSINNRLRGRVESAIAGLRILSSDRGERLAAARGIEPSVATAPLLARALAVERDPEVRAVLRQTEAAARLMGTDADSRIAAIAVLGESADDRVKALLQPLTVRDATGAFAESDARVRQAAIEALSSIEVRLLVADYAGRLFTGLSLGSILLLAALGLAITYGLLGVINMAHGEMLMIGAYATYATQQVFRTHFPGSVDWYLPCALPVSFAAAALVGMALERSVIRWLYGRPLETLLATWGISLFLIQGVRQLFGAQNVEVANPAWMSGAASVANVVLPYNRLVIVAFSGAVLLLVWALLARTRLGLFIRGVTQNRTMASCTGVPTGRVDLLAFGLGSGIGGLAGCALSQVGNVGPDLGQSYIIDSFMVVVLGGVGQLLGTVYAALGLGVASKLLEAHLGAVPTKILVLVLIIAFIQKRPQGLFALRGRSVEA